MTSPLSEGLRKLADLVLRLSLHELSETGALSTVVTALRRAADALDEVAADFHECGQDFCRVEAERDELRLQCDYAIKNQELERAIADELRQQLGEQAEAYTAVRNLIGKAVERAEAQAARYKAALKPARDALEYFASSRRSSFDMSRADEPLALVKEALREPETGGET